MKRTWLIITVASLLVLFGCAPHQIKPLPAGQELRRVIQVEVADQRLLYQCQSFWSAEQFPEISEGDLKARFKVNYDVDAKEFAFSFEPASYSTLTRCSIYGAITRSGSKYTADLLWLLKPYELDFIDDDFEESKTGLSWQGMANSMPMSIEVRCPPQECIYGAWQEPVGHCHGHIWWPASQ